MVGTHSDRPTPYPADAVSFDERSHSYLGYVLRFEGTIDDEPGEFIIALG
jgi:hypothetical protein